MSIGDRIKELRKALGLTQQEFGDRIGIKRNSVALIEGGRTTSEQTLVSICREFDVREEWLRNGIEPMYLPKTEESEPLEVLLKSRNVTPEDRILIENFLGLSNSSRAEVISFVQKCAAELSAIPFEESPTEADILAELKSLKNENLELRARLEAIEKEDEIAEEPLAKVRKKSAF